MSRKAPKPAVVAFKVEEELAKLLNELPNKSAFIRKAIIAQLGMACPLCHGEGIVPRGLHDHYAPLLSGLNTRQCDGCGNKQPIQGSTDPGVLAPPDQDRLQQFFHGGPFYCGKCYVKAPACDDCGWHITPEKAAEHHRTAHDN